MKRTIEFKILSPERTVYASTVEKVTVRTVTGDITILPKHMSLVSLLAPGELVVYKDDTPHGFVIADGIVEVKPDSRVVVLADVAERAEEIDEEEANKARRRAEKMLEGKESLSSEQFAKFQAILEREMAKIKVARKYHRKA
jgi:F-type H+-transporting ATPase subunit epsilon